MAYTLMRGIQDVEPSHIMRFYHGQDDQAISNSTGLAKPLSRPINAALARLGGSRCVVDRGAASRIIHETASFDVLHLHNLHGYYLKYEELLFAWRTRPVVWTWHDMWGATGRCAHSFQCQGWLAGCTSCLHKEFYPAAWIDVAAAEYSAKTELFRSLEKLSIVTPSKWLADIAKKRGLTRGRIEIIPNPIDARTFAYVSNAEARGHLGLDPNAKYILFVAADCESPYKGYRDFEYLLENSDLTGLVVGNPPKKRSAKAIYAGAISDPTILSHYYSAADVTVVPSLQDTFPNVVLESMACGTPIVGYAAGGIPSQMPQFWDGLVKIGDKAALLDKIRDFVSGGGTTDQLANQLKEYVTSTYDINVVARRYLELYQRLRDCEA